MKKNFINEIAHIMEMLRNPKVKQGVKSLNLYDKMVLENSLKEELRVDDLFIGNGSGFKVIYLIGLYESMSMPFCIRVSPTFDFDSPYDIKVEPYSIVELDEKLDEKLDETNLHSVQCTLKFRMESILDRYTKNGNKQKGWV